MAEESDEEEEYRGGDDDNCLQACYLLHGKPTSSSKSRKTEKDDPHSRSKAAFHIIWSHIERAVQAALEEVNSECFQSIQQWISSRQFCKAQLNLYMQKKTNVFNGGSLSTKRLNTAVLFTGSVESSDSQAVFDSLSEYLNGERFRVARLQPDSLLGKVGVSVPLRTLFYQFIGVKPETTDMEILAAWHREPSNQKLVLVVIIEDAERSSGPALAELLLILSEWAMELPLILIMGMSTTGESLRMLLPASLMDRLHIQCFSLQPPLERLEAVIQAVLIKCPFIFTWGGTVVKYFYEVFHTHDNSVSSFLRILKVSCIEHFCRQPLSFLCVELIGSPNEANIEAACSKLPASSGGADMKKRLASDLWRYKSNRKNWSSAFQCFLAAGKWLDFTFFDVFYGALTSSNPSPMEKHSSSTLSQIVENLRVLSTTKLAKLVEDWTSLAADSQCFKELELLKNQVAECSNFESTSAITPTKCFSSAASSRRLRSLMSCRSPLEAPISSPPQKQQKRSDADDQKASLLKLARGFLELLQRDYLVAPETYSSHEVFCFNNVEALKKSLTGETRKRIHSDLFNSQARLKCTCCPADGSLSSSLHDTALAYNLSHEHNELINVHDWYQSFEMVRSEQANKKQRRKNSEQSSSRSDEARTQAAFCKAVAELHVTGLLRLPKKKHPDSVQRIGFGLLNT